MAVVENAVRLLVPEKLYDAGAVLGRPSVVPAVPGTYAWYFAQVPAGVPTNGCQRLGEAWLLYVGISPKKPSSDGRKSRQTLRAVPLDELADRLARLWAADQPTCRPLRR